jgi:dTDP-4-dehydrorhamnose 3,5-epimerase
MKFIKTSLEGAYLIEPELLCDERGFFSRTYCGNEFSASELPFRIVQSSISFNKLRGTLRGMHYQKEPHSEEKLVRCTHGSIYDVIIDLRSDSTTYMRWYGVELTATNHLSVYIPIGFAHGFITLSDDAEVLYYMSEFYDPGGACGVRWDDPAFKINWPIPPKVISGRDYVYPNFQ